MKVLAIAAILILSACSAPPQIVYATPVPTSTPQGAIDAPATGTPAPTPAITPEPIPSVEEVPTEEPAIEAPGAIAFNKYGPVADDNFDLRVVKVNFNAAKALKKANMFNTAPPKGMVAVLVYIQYKNIGGTRAALDPMGTLKAIGVSGTEYDGFTDPTCGVHPDPDVQMSNPTLRKGGTAKGWGACFVVDKADAAGLQMFWDDSYGTNPDRFVYFNLK